MTAREASPPIFYNHNNNVDGVEVLKKFKPRIITSDMEDGDMRIEENRLKILKKFKILSSCIVYIGLNNNGLATKVNSRQGDSFVASDAIFTNDPHLSLGLLTADCIPISVVDPTRQVTGLIHCGWKEIYKGVIKNSIDLLDKVFDSRPQDLRVHMGPSISKESYEVGWDVAKHFEEYVGVLSSHDLLKYHLDIKEVAARQFEALGVRCAPERSPICTYDSDDMFYSHRRFTHTKLKKDNGRFLTILGLNGS